MNKTIHELNALVTLANDDELIVYDVATGTSKKIKKSDLKNQLASDFIIDAVQDGNLKAVTSNAVFDSLNIIGGYLEVTTAMTCLASETLGTLTLAKGFYLVIYTSSFVTDDGATQFSLTNGTGILHANTTIQQRSWRPQQICYAEVTSNTADINILSVTDYTAQGTGILLAIRLR